MLFLHLKKGHFATFSELPQEIHMAAAENEETPGGHFENALVIRFPEGRVRPAAGQPAQTQKRRMPVDSVTSRISLDENPVSGPNRARTALSFGKRSGSQTPYRSCFLRTSGTKRPIK